MSSGVHSTYNPYGKNLARQKQRRFFLKLFGIGMISVILVVVLTYLIFYSSWMRISEVNITGLKTVELTDIISVVDSLKNESLFGLLNLQPQLNILFFDDKYLHEKILNRYSVIKNVEVIKKFPHNIIVNIEERIPLGTWCIADNCSYFDESGTLWGKSLRSSGALLLNVDDLRNLSNAIKSLEPEVLNPVIEVVDGLDMLKIKTIKIEIPKDSIGDFQAHTSRGYYLMFHNQTNISEQIKILKIFLDEKGTDFSPVYIDLRIEGRVYYK